MRDLAAGTYRARVTCTGCHSEARTVVVEDDATTRLDLDLRPGSGLEAINVPRLTGTPVPGATVRTTAGRWTRSGLTYRYTWSVDGRTVAGERRARIVVRRGWVGHDLQVEVRATTPGGTLRHATSLPLRVRARG